MNLTEHTENRFTKDKDKLESYLMRIVQRYFDTEQEHSRNDTEAIVIESLTRLKRILLNDTDYIFNINNEAGDVCLTIRKLGGEQVFEKNTAFNKDFGNETGTVCEGNDPRLSDERMPTEHVHKICDIETLQNTIDDILFSQDTHIHDNESILDMIRYSGRLAQIDLTVLETIQASVDRQAENLLELQKEAGSLHEHKQDQLLTLKNTLTECMDRIKSIVTNAVSWLNNAKRYTAEQTSSMRIWYESLIRDFVTDEQLAMLKQTVSTYETYVIDGEIQIPDGRPNMSYDGSETIIDQQTDVLHNIPQSVMNGITNGRVKMWFMHDKDGITIKYPLPFVSIMDDGTQVVVQGSYDNSGNMEIRADVVCEIHGIASQQNFYDDETIIVPIDEEISFFDAREKNLCLIDSITKNNAIKLLLSSGNDYWIQGFNNDGYGNGFFDNSDNHMQFTYWDSGEPREQLFCSAIYINAHKKWAAGHPSEHKGYIAEYKIKHLSDYFENPSIYYQVYGRKGVS